jgi:pimeloyl-ACP methyl ester carboxylesterase
VSVPKHLDLAPEVSASRVDAASGELAALVATPPAGIPRRPEALLVPGYTGSKEDFIHLLPLLARAGHPATAIDLRGQFESGGPEDVAAYTISTLAADVASLLPDAEPGHLLGHSFGGLVCRAAVLAGASVRSLTLLCSGPGALGGNRGALVEMMRPLLADGGVPAVWEASASLPADPSAPPVPGAVQDFLKRRFLASPAAALLGMGTELTSAADRTAELAMAGVPILVACGENDDAWSPAEQRQMAQRLAASYVEFPGAGHSPAVEVPELVAAALEEFWSLT